MTCDSQPRVLLTIKNFIVSHVSNKAEPAYYYSTLNAFTPLLTQEAMNNNAIMPVHTWLQRAVQLAHAHPLYIPPLVSHLHWLTNLTYARLWSTFTKHSFSSFPTGSQLGPLGLPHLLCAGAGSPRDEAAHPPGPSHPGTRHPASLRAPVLSATAPRHPNPWFAFSMHSIP